MPDGEILLHVTYGGWTRFDLPLEFVWPGYTNFRAEVDEYGTYRIYGKSDPDYAPIKQAVKSCPCCGRTIP